MSHGDEVAEIPSGFRVVARSSDCAHAAVEYPEKKIFGVQFHPEVTHTPRGMDILNNFIRTCSPSSWTMKDYLETLTNEIPQQVKDNKVFILVSGGVDSTVAFTLLDMILGKERVYGLLIDNGLMRTGEVEETNKALRALGLDNLHVEDASRIFLDRLKDIYEPEQKRKIIGQTFIEVKDMVAERLNLASADWLLGQGTIYPDTIETGGTKHASVIKTHHNRIDLIAEMIKNGKVVEPLKDLYKDEVRALGTLLNLPSHLLLRHPFPGPGLGVRILCCNSANPVPNEEEVLSKIEKLIALDRKVKARVLPIKSVGVQGDHRTYRHAAALFLDSLEQLEDETFYDHLVSIPNRISEINRVVVSIAHMSRNVNSSEVDQDKRIVNFDKMCVTPSYITEERVKLLQAADEIVTRVIREENLYDEIWQFPVALLPIGYSAGGQSIVLRPVDSKEAMTATAHKLSKAVLKKITDQILNLNGVHFLFIDLTSKPPGTIEWE
eukprot:TRINITY_DN947_c0_g1_i1.p1 TRINITY_DN947_c0_g1~~TRINITY_DN947_c0_g1_i1.p1  ORF type:complete len:495 (-),score=101.04 TRINITY_DN947_c0_g1_i1:53-1537(-)